MARGPRPSTSRFRCANTGFCNVGNFGSMHRMDYTAIGAEVNLAARLQSIAEPGHIVVSYDTYVLARDIVAACTLPEISVKGIGRMVVPYVVEGVLDEAGRKIEIFSEHMTGLDFYLDPRAVDAAAIERIRATLKNAIAVLEGRDREEAPAEVTRPDQKSFPSRANDKAT